MTKEEYIYQTLAENALYIESELKRMLLKRKIGVTDELLRSLSYKVYAAEQRFSGKYTLSFQTYGRFVDMGAGRMSKIENVDTNGKLLKRRRPKKWYSKTVYGIIYGRLAEKLVVNLQEQALDDVKQSLTL